MPRIHAISTKITEDENWYNPMWSRVAESIKECLLNDIIIPTLRERIDDCSSELSSHGHNQYIYECSILPHYGITNYVFLFDKITRKFIPISRCFDNTPDGDIKWLPKQYRDTNRYHWGIVCMFSRRNHAMFKWPVRQAEPQNKDHSSWPCMIRDAKRIGYNVMTSIDTTFLEKIEKALLNKVSLMW